ncbi:acyl-CoA dehydrogenase family protein [Ferrimonas sp. SCSIO 43195]|uniref:acyl-CoA dehydrogenase family protein n=1 Tax=Ferrimonas sp. SCSIO 43195 TaxID=2822844 RepID=UPI002075CBB7|nr:acyl-CoA dehydrogenase family protein [Ferrimonas sp. SCSIO 43195]USD39251.1 acyl-CoA dehydrogenase family protein [Ferrimonas sp. SCSIO 43195]
MSTSQPAVSILAETHDVFNQVPPLEHYNLYDNDQPLKELLAREGGNWGLERVRRLGQTLGEPQWIEKGFLANRHKPEFHSHDRFGNRIDWVEFHPAYHELMTLAIDAGIPTLPWTTPKAGAHVVRMALNYLYNQNDAGSGCPLTMTFAAVPPLAKAKGEASAWLAKLLQGRYDPANKPSSDKLGVTIGMAMTEKQGGTDVRANTTVATQLEGDRYELVGHKWFCSAPMCDGFLTLAQTAAGLTCFLLPRWRPDGRRNEFYVQRLKNKMGNVSNASSEVEFRGALGWRLGEEGRGVATIIEMVALTRYDCMIGSTSMMRQAVAQVTHHIAHRSVMGKPLMEQPLMQNVVADLCLEVEGALAMTGRMARALDAPDDPQEQLLLRVGTAIGKYWICKRATHHIGEAQECLGGIGYVEESILPRLYREAPVNSIWEGSGNVQCLDVLRAIGKTPQAMEVYFSELELARGGHRLYDAYLDDTREQFQALTDFEYQGRHMVERLAKLMQAAQLIFAGNAGVIDAFCASRLGPGRGLCFGNLPLGIDCLAIIERARPKVMAGE